ncbi:Potassium channel AKT1 [Diplonema papillatum]|nr:Potassium channel AKT1 [Diplonema papillatum]
MRGSNGKGPVDSQLSRPNNLRSSEILKAAEEEDDDQETCPLPSSPTIAVTLADVNATLALLVQSNTQHSAELGKMRVAHKMQFCALQSKVMALERTISSFQSHSAEKNSAESQREPAVAGCSDPLARLVPVQACAMDVNKMWFGGPLSSHSPKTSSKPQLSSPTTSARSRTGFDDPPTCSDAHPPTNKKDALHHGEDESVLEDVVSHPVVEDSNNHKAAAVKDEVRSASLGLCSPHTHKLPSFPPDNEQVSIDRDSAHEAAYIGSESSSNFHSKVQNAARSMAVTAAQTPGSIILPDNSLRIVADIMYLVVTVIETSKAFFSIIWPDAMRQSSDLAFMLFFSAFHAFFVWLVARTAVLDGYQLEDREPKAILTLYWQSWLVFDVATAVPWDAVLFIARWGRFFGIIRLLHAVRVPYLFKTANPLKQPSSWVTVVNVIFWSCWCLNVIAFLFRMINHLEAASSSTHSKDVFDEYLDALYWATITISSVGFGDIVPENRWSRLYTIPVVLLSVLILSIITGQVASSVIRLDAFSSIVKEKKAKLYSLMERYQVPWEVQKEAFSIYPTILETSLKDYFDILSDLPPFMQEKVILCVKKKLVSQVSLFKNVNDQTLTALAAVTQQVLVAPNESIIVAGSIGYEMYFIAQGVVQVLVQDAYGDEICAATLQSGSWFGEIALLRCTERTASVRSVTACSCFKLLKDDFMGIIEMFPEFRQQIQDLVEHRLHQNAPRMPRGHHSVVESEDMGLTKTMSMSQSEANTKQDNTLFRKSVATSATGCPQSSSHGDSLGSGIGETIHTPRSPSGTSHRFSNARNPSRVDNPLERPIFSPQTNRRTTDEKKMTNGFRGRLNRVSHAVVPSAGAFHLDRILTNEEEEEIGSRLVGPSCPSSPQKKQFSSFNIRVRQSHASRTDRSAGVDCEARDANQSEPNSPSTRAPASPKTCRSNLLDQPKERH